MAASDRESERPATGALVMMSLIAAGGGIPKTHACTLMRSAWSRLSYVCAESSAGGKEVVGRRERRV